MNTDEKVKAARIAKLGGPVKPGDFEKVQSMTNEDLSNWQAGHKQGSPSWILADQEWQRRRSSRVGEELTNDKSSERKQTALANSGQIWARIEEEYDCSKKAFGGKINFVEDKFKRTILFRDVAHAFQLAHSGFSKSAVILAGGVIEELLRLYLAKKGIKAKNKTFDSYVTACEEQGFLKKGVVQLSASVRHFRNLVHVSNETDKRYTVSKSTAKTAASSIFTIVNDFQ